MSNQSIYDIMNELPATFINRVTQCEDVGQLRKMLLKYGCYNRRAVINARIENLNYLIANP